MKYKEKKDFEPINIIYEPVSKENELVICYFTNDIHFAYRSYINKKQKWKETILHQTVRQCHYCENYFAKSQDAMIKHTTFVRQERELFTLLKMEK